MNKAEFQLQAVSDPRLAVHATSPLPAWLWSTDGSQILWSNPVGARVFDGANAVELSGRTFGPADAQRRQVAQLAHRLPAAGAIRLERLRGFGAALGMLVTCGCARLDFADGGQGVLIAAVEPVGRPMPLVERLQRLIEGIETPIAAFARDGMLVAASNSARSVPGFHNLCEAGLEEARCDALKEGRSEAPVGIGHMVLQRVGAGADVGLVALIEPGVAAAQETERIAPPGDLPLPDYERPTLSGEAPAEFALIDETPETSATETPAVEAIAAEQPSEPSPIEVDCEQSPAEAEAAAEPAPPPIAATSTETPTPPSIAPQTLDVLSESPPQPRRHPLRFTWQMDSEGRFSISRDEFTDLIGVRPDAAPGRKWSEIAEAFALDPEGRVASAVATHGTWSGITLQWPVDGGGTLPVELSGLPIYDHAGNFTGYRGFGVCRDLDELARLDATRQHEVCSDQPAQGAISSGSAGGQSEPPPIEGEAAAVETAAPLAAPESAGPETADFDEPAEQPDQALRNVVPFPIAEARAPVLTPVENSAFNELARQLSARLEAENGANASGAAKAGNEPPHWLTHPEPPARGETGRDRLLLDLLPDGVLIYRLDRLLYANRAFLDRIGYTSLHALEQAGGLDALYVEPGVSSVSSTSDTGTPVAISAEPATAEAMPTPAIDARLYAISWDDESAHALIFAGTAAQSLASVATAINPAPAAEAPSAPAQSASRASAEEPGAIRDTTADGIVKFDAEGNISSSDRNAETLSGHDAAEPAHRNLATVFTPEGQSAVLDYLGGLEGPELASLLEPGRDLSQTRRSESELREARRLAEQAADAKADLLARISHEIRTPLNAIIGFAEVMIGERFGALCNERYTEYMKDIRASGERVIAIIDGLADLSRIETGRPDLAFTRQNLNGLVASCVAAMQPQANRERIIIRTSLANMLPPVVADPTALREITHNLISNSLHLANAGGQVIVSTALTDFGDVVLRVRDTGPGLNDNEVAAAMEPFRTQGPSEQAPEASPVSLSLTKALVEANRAKFHIRTGQRSGTLIEVVFPPAMART
jgi:signal transduction histidine kinase/PAS domain-containing protein